MGFWDSARSVVDRVTGNAANVSLAMDPQVVAPGQTAQVQISIKNGLAALDVRAVLFEIEAVEEINLPRNADWTNVVADAAATAAGGKPNPQHQAANQVSHYSGNTYEAAVKVASALSLSPAEERKFQGTFRLPGHVQPSYEGKYSKHAWRLRARLDVLGVDPGTGWLAFRVVVPQ
jgi:sporulation-control protein spo0M